MSEIIGGIIGWFKLKTASFPDECAMSLWLRVFGTNEIQPAPAALLEHLQRLGYQARGHFKGDDLGWFAAQLFFNPDEPPCQLERFLAAEEGIRNELNTWAAWLETIEDNPHAARLMQHMIGTKQLFTLH